MSKHNINFKNCRIPLVASALGFSGTLLCFYLSFIPTQTFAANIVDPGEVRTLSQIDTMQQMSQQICINSREHETKQLEDIREPGKKYWVTKLKDGNCWMAQNLDFDIPNTLSGDTSNVTGTINIDIERVPDFTQWGQNSVDDAKLKNYYDPGKLYYNGANGMATSICGAVLGDASIGGVGTPYGVEKIGDGLKTFLEHCTNFSRVGNDEHYSVGNFYTWSAATVGSGDNLESVEDGNAIMSICPKGWQLPNTSAYSSDIDRTFANLLNLYGMGINNQDGTLVGLSNSMLYGNPIYLVYGGIIFRPGYSWAGASGNYWSATPASSSTSYALTFYTKDIFPTSASQRHNGYSVRCLAMGGWLDSYADPNDQANVAIVVAPVISIDVTKHADKMETDFTHVATDTITARVGSNLPYKVLISTKESNLTSTDIDSSTNAPIEQVIPMINHQDGSKIAAGVSSWGIGKDNDIKVTRISSVDGSSNVVNQPTITKDTIYYPVGIDPERVLFYTSSSAATEILEFPVAIAVGSTIPIGTYSTTVTLTAVAN